MMIDHMILFSNLTSFFPQTCTYTTPLAEMLSAKSRSSLSMSIPSSPHNFVHLDSRLTIAMVPLWYTVQVQ